MPRKKREKTVAKPPRATKNLEPPRRIVGIQQASRYAGVSRWTLRTWIMEGKLPFVQYPGKGEADLRGAKVDLNDLDAFIERSKDRNV